MKTKTYFIDTNCFLRLLLQDNKDQGSKVKTLFEEALHRKIILHSSVIVMFELYWVLASSYDKKKDDIIEILQKILDLGYVRIENRQVFQRTLILFAQNGIEIEDCYHIAYSESLGLDEFMTFDKKLQKVFERKD